MSRSAVGKARLDRGQREERWPFSRRELRRPQELNSYDVLEADLSTFVEWDADMEGSTADVYRNGHCEDPTVPRDWCELAEDVETLYHPETGEATDLWADVVVDRDGRFLRFVDEKLNKKYPMRMRPGWRDTERYAGADHLASWVVELEGSAKRGARAPGDKAAVRAAIRKTVE